MILYSLKLSLMGMPVVLCWQSQHIPGCCCEVEMRTLHCMRYAETSSVVMPSVYVCIFVCVYTLYYAQSAASANKKTMHC